jgi:thiol-disulfide isomerase/thioredoxin
MTDSPTPESKGIRRRRWWIDIALVLAVFFGLQYFLTRDVVRGPLPPFEGVLANGSALSSEQWRRRHEGEPFVLYVWATWCPICKTVEGSVDALARDAPVLTLAMQSGQAVEVQRFLAARGRPWPTLVDDDGRLARGLGVHAVPTLLFVGPSGTVQSVTQGYTSEAGMRLRLWWAGWRG